jgi:two-component sensor histidine kinase
MNMSPVSDYMPHGMCLLWQPPLMALHVVSDAVIAAAYFSIPLAIAWFVRRRTDLNAQYKAVAVLFAVFIAACGATHVMGIVVLWQPDYVAEGALKAFTAIVSLATAAALPFLLPELLRIPSPKTLEAEIRAHKATLEQLEAARLRLADLVLVKEDDRVETNRRFESALRGSPVTVSEQDAELRYTWTFNLPARRSEAEFVGRTEEDLFSPQTADALRGLKRAALDQRVAKRAEVFVEDKNALGLWFDLRVEPMRLRGGGWGVISTGTDITPLKRQQEHLELLMRELNHRSKNLLTIVLSIARQTARSFEVPKDFAVRLQERLAALAHAHDVVAAASWRDADLRAIIEGQLNHQIKTFGDRISLEGPGISLPPEAAHYVGLALHELGSNATKHGALSENEGTVTIAWTTTKSPDGGELQLTWTEKTTRTLGTRGPPSFGSGILTKYAPRAVRGAAELIFEEAGICWRLTAPIGDGRGAAATDRTAPNERAL